MTHRFVYSPGAATAVCVGDWGILIGLPPGHPIVGRLYGTLLDTPDMGRITDVLAETYGAFTDVAVLHAVDPVHVFLWGTANAESTGGVTVQGRPVGTEHRLTGMVGVWTGADPVPSAGDMLPAGSGVFPARRLESNLAPPVAQPIAPPVAQPVAHLAAGSPSMARPPLPPAVPPMTVAPPAPVPPFVPSEPAHPYGSPPPAPPYARPPRDEMYVPVAPPPMTAADQRPIIDVDFTVTEKLALARMCRSGHINPAHLEDCRVCGGPLGGAPTDVAHPSLGRLVISTGGVVELDHDCLLGRNPQLPANFSGTPPELVKVADPTKDVSNRHLQIRVHQWRVLVRDLGSTNGTEIIRPGQPPMALVAGHEIPIEPGCRIVLGGAVTLSYEG